MDTFSTEVSKELFSQFPQWREFARSETADDGTEYLVIEVPAPADSGADYGLTIDTANGEVTVGFDNYHSHFDSLVGDGEHFGTKAALAFVRQILAERVGIVSWWCNETWRGSAQIEAGTSPTVPTWTTASDINRVRVRSWHGALNHDGGA